MTSKISWSFHDSFGKFFLDLRFELVDQKKSSNMKTCISLVVMTLIVSFRSTDADNKFKVTLDFTPGGSVALAKFYTFLQSIRLIATKKDETGLQIVGGGLCTISSRPTLYEPFQRYIKMWTENECGFDGELGTDMHVILYFGRNYIMWRSWAYEALEPYYAMNKKVLPDRNSYEEGFRDGNPTDFIVKITATGMGKTFVWQQVPNDRAQLMLDPSKSVYDHGIYLVKRQTTGFSLENIYYDPYEVRGYLT
ncbi:unnamed protein product [Caenorhabditis auriculariae]|uniref:Uncharacterized protein n=1 Tax=Caenorhabditis auriculariae TaxID=2777116 RepID=A0A8S1HAN8_9PELO|nr:unnamed protein product [Caenorhabditis auriculariae]